MLRGVSDKFSLIGILYVPLPSDIVQREEVVKNGAVTVWQQPVEKAQKVGKIDVCLSVCQLKFFMLFSYAR